MITLVRFQTLHPLAMAALCVLAIAITPLSAFAVASGDQSQRTESGDKDYAAGIRAFEARDWQGVVDNMQKVVVRRPWHDNAWSRMGYAERKLGNYDKALEHYGKALKLNPHNRGALEYLGEAYLDLGQPDRAEEMLNKLEAECKRVAIGFTNGGWKSGCEEWQDLKDALEDYKSITDSAQR